MSGAVLAAILLAAVAKTPPHAKAKQIVHPVTAEDYLALSGAELQLGKPADAESTARTGLKKHPESQGFHLAIGDAQVGRGKPADAFYEYQWEILRAGAAAPSGASAAERLGALLKDARGSNTDQMRKIAEAIAMTGEDPAGALKILDHEYSARGEIFVLRLVLAEASAAAGKTARAEKLFRGLIAEDPRFVPAYAALARLLDTDGRHKEAEALLSKARDIDANSWALAPEPSSSPTPAPPPPP